MGSLLRNVIFLRRTIHSLTAIAPVPVVSRPVRCCELFVSQRQYDWMAVSRRAAKARCRWRQPPAAQNAKNSSGGAAAIDGCPYTVASPRLNTKQLLFRWLAPPAPGCRCSAAECLYPRHSFFRSAAGMSTSSRMFALLRRTACSPTHAKSAEIRSRSPHCPVAQVSVPKFQPIVTNASDSSLTSSFARGMSLESRSPTA